MTTYNQLSQEVKGCAIGVSQGQERQYTTTLKEERRSSLGVDKTTTEYHITRKVIERDHYTLR